MPAGKDVAIAVSAKIRPKLSKMILSGLEWGLTMHFIMTALAFCFLSAVLLGLL